MPYLDISVGLDEVYSGEAGPPHLEADGDPHLAFQPLGLFHHYNHSTTQAGFGLWLADDALGL